MSGSQGQREASVWLPLTRQKFLELERGTPLRDHRGRRWTVHTPAHEREGRWVSILRSSDLVRLVEERFADDYILLPGGTPDV